MIAKALRSFPSVSVEAEWYMEALAPYPVEIVEKAIREVMLNHKYPNAPMPAVFREAAERMLPRDNSNREFLDSLTPRPKDPEVTKGLEDLSKSLSTDEPERRVSRPHHVHMPDELREKLLRKMEKA